MDSFFRKLPLSVKLILIGLIPILFLIYLSAQLYIEKNAKVRIIEAHIVDINEAGNISELIYNLERERKLSFEYTLKKDSFGRLIIQRPITDSFINILKKSDDADIANFSDYTFIDQLDSMRKLIDTSLNFPPDKVVEYYSTSVLRLNTLNPISAVSNTYMQSIYKDLIAQKNLFEILTHLLILRTNIYNVLYQKKFAQETIQNNLSTYNLYKSYEREFLMKASPASISLYNNVKNSQAVKPILDYVDKIFSKNIFDSSYSAESWWKNSATGMREIKNQQIALQKKSETGMNAIYKSELKSKNKTLVLLIAAIILIVSFVFYTIRVITQMLRELKIGAEKISVGKTGLEFYNMPDDVMGSLTESILEIDKNNIEIAHAAKAIGAGNFTVAVNPRSDEDLLGNSIQKMKEDLYKLTLEKDKVQEDTLELMKRKDDFLSIASHELKTPVTSLKAYTQLMQMDARDDGNVKKEEMLLKMDLQIDKLTNLITDLLDASKIQNGKLIYNWTYFQLNDLIKETIDDIKPDVSKPIVLLEKNDIAQVHADKERIAQVLNNIINNAVKYCVQSEKIIVNVINDGYNVTCSVQDFGAGIVKAQQHRIFEEFYRVTGNNLHTYPGLGLGLFIAKDIIDRHHGKIWVDSEKGKGSTFYFRLPVSKNRSKKDTDLKESVSK